MKASIIERKRAPHLARDEDENVSTAEPGDFLEHEGIKVRLNATCIGFSRRCGEILADADCASGDREISESHVLLAVGGRPNTNDFWRTNAGVTVMSGGRLSFDD
jgi:pyruvate/2-oxoglutarate dehydrogenase complex dihydrolipoamide dehydrogenase (E3) component